MNAAYDRIAAQWAGVRQRIHPKEARYLALLLETADRQLPILDLGCGTGRPIAEFLVREGWRVVGVDASAAMLAEARKIMPQGEWIHADMETVEFDEPFGAVVCWDALFHLARAWHGPIAAKTHRWLAPGGRLMLSTGGSSQPPFTDTMWDHEFFYDSHAPWAFRPMLEEAGFRIVVAELAQPPDAGRDKGKYAWVVEKPLRPGPAIRS